MAVDSRDKRFSLISLSLWNGRVVVNPTGAIDTGEERAQYALSYARSFEQAIFLPIWALNSNRTIGLVMEP